MFDYQKYVAYNDAIFEYFFNSDRAGQLTTLAFDEEAASQIGSEFDMSAIEFASALTSQIRAVVNFAADNPYKFWFRRHARESTGLLACAVLVMSRLGTTADGELQHQGFHAAYNRDVLGLLKVEPSPGFSMQDDLWTRFATYLGKDERGALGRITFFKLIGYTHINYPASQCLVRMSDRRRLHTLFARYCNPEHALDHSELVRVFDDYTAGFSVMFRRAYVAVASSDDLAQEFWDIVDGEFAVWQAAPEQVARVTRARARPRDSFQEESPTERRATNNTLAWSGPSGIAQPVVPQNVSRVRIRPAPLKPGLRSATSRLILIQPYRQLAELFAEIWIPAGENVVPEAAGHVHDGWIRLDGQVDSEMFDEGFERVYSGFRVSREGSSLVAFTLEERSWVETHVFKVGTPLRLVCSAEYTEQLGSLRAQGLVCEEVSMQTTGLRCFSITLPAEASREALPEILKEELSAAQTSIKLFSGLRLRNGTFLRDGPPLVTFAHPTCALAEVYVDDVAVGVAERDVPFRMPAHQARSSRHTVRILDRTRTFVTCDADGEENEAESAPDSGLGTIVASHPPRLDSSLSAEALHTAALGRMNAVVVVGAEILLPYERAGK